MSTDVPSSPIHTYNYRGVGGLSPRVQNDHVMLYSTALPPSKKKGEDHMRRDPLAVWTRPDVDLHDDCRADLRLVYPIRYHQRVREMGVVKPQSLVNLLRYREQIHERGKNGRTWRITEPESPVVNL